MYITCTTFILLVLAPFVLAGKYGTGDPPRQQYDYVIVGSGNSGSVVAKRLTDDPRNFKVLVLEAGFPSQSDLGGTQFAAARYDTDANGQFVPGRPLTVFDIPSFYQTTYNNGQAVQERGYVPVGADWGITSNYPVFQGKIVGGSGCHNGGAWVRGDAGVFELWNVTGWSYNDLLPYYKLSENATYPGAFSFPSAHNFSGILEVSEVAVISAEANITIATCANAPGFGAFVDINAQTTGCGTFPVSVRRGIRDSAALGYLLPSLQKNNLDVIYYAQATAILFAESRNAPPKAIGVKWVDLLTNRTYTIDAGVEVILAAGPLNTPKLLWFSGIGPADELNRWGIPVLVNNTNVGRHIRNGFAVSVIVNSPKTVAPNLNFVANAALQYAQSGTGYFAAAQTGTGALFKSDPSLPYPDLALGDHFVYPSFINSLHAFTAGPSSPLYADGNITLVSNNPLDPPHLYQPIFTHPEDIATTIKAIQLVRQLLTFEPAASFFGSEVTPGANVTSDADLAAFIQAAGSIATYAHYTGSCKMGNIGDPSAVVDPRLRVLGVTSLRIVDVSINAGPLRGGNLPHATSIGVAEKAAALILADAP